MQRFSSEVGSKVDGLVKVDLEPLEYHWKESTKVNFKPFLRLSGYWYLEFPIRWVDHNYSLLLANVLMNWFQYFRSCLAIGRSDMLIGLQSPTWSSMQCEFSLENCIVSTSLSPLKETIEKIISFNSHTLLMCYSSAMKTDKNAKTFVYKIVDRKMIRDRKKHTFL